MGSSHAIGRNVMQKISLAAAQKATRRIITHTSDSALRYMRRVGPDFHMFIALAVLVSGPLTDG